MGRDHLDEGPTEEPFAPGEVLEVRGQPIAPRRSRWWGAVFEGISIGTLTRILGDDLGGRPMVLVTAVYVVVTTARWGKQLGKVLAGTRIADHVTGALPTWRQAVVRWAVPEVPAAIVFVWPSVVTALVSLLWLVAVYAPILGADQRGLHDRAAGTVVVLSA